MMRHLNQPYSEIKKMTIEEANIFIKTWEDEQKEIEWEYKKMERKARRR